MGVASVVVYLDVGTTNSRAWLVNDGSIVGRATEAVGIRDCAREGANESLKQAVRRLIHTLLSDSGGIAHYVAAAGMITSELGLAAVPHVDVPAGVPEIRAGMQEHHFPEITDLPVVLIPGVRSGSALTSVHNISETDFMRGEETLCLGLLHNELLQPGDVLLNLGSHWKLIGTDPEGRIAWSWSSLSGELLHAVQTSTILASSLPSVFPDTLNLDWVRAGRDEQRRSGLSRALYCVRLLQQRTQCTAEERFAFAAGALAAGDIEPHLNAGTLQNRSIAITGGKAITSVWQCLLTDAGNRATALDAAQVEAGQVAGMHLLLKHRA